MRVIKLNQIVDKDIVIIPNTSIEYKMFIEALVDTRYNLQNRAYSRSWFNAQEKVSNINNHLWENIGITENLSSIQTKEFFDYDYQDVNIDKSTLDLTAPLWQNSEALYTLGYYITIGNSTPPCDYPVTVQSVICLQPLIGGGSVENPPSEN